MCSPWGSESLEVNNSNPVKWPKLSLLSPSAINTQRLLWRTLTNRRLQFGSQVRLCVTVSVKQGVGTKQHADSAVSPNKWQWSKLLIVRFERPQSRWYSRALLVSLIQSQQKQCININVCTQNNKLPEITISLLSECTHCHYFNATSTNKVQPCTQTLVYIWAYNTQGTCKMVWRENWSFFKTWNKCISYSGCDYV